MRDEGQGPKSRLFVFSQFLEINQKVNMTNFVVFTVSNCALRQPKIANYDILLTDKNN